MALALALAFWANHNSAHLIYKKALKIKQEINECEKEYSINCMDCELTALWRKWLDNDTYFKLNEKVDRNEIINQ